MDLKRRIRDAVDTAYQEGYRHFLCGMAQGCDLYFCECVLALRARHPDVTVEAAIPCPTQAAEWPEAEQVRYRTLVRACDYETMVSDHYTRDCMQRRNRYLVDHASLLIAVCDGTAGGHPVHRGIRPAAAAEHRGPAGGGDGGEKKSGAPGTFLILRPSVSPEHKT